MKRKPQDIRRKPTSPQQDLFGGMALPVRIESEQGQRFLVSIVNGEMVEVNELWAVTACQPDQSPVEWLKRKETQHLMGILSDQLGLRASQLVKVLAKGTRVFAHWQIAMAYAKFLSPDIHLQINQVFRERLQELVDPELGLKRATQLYIAQYKHQGKSDAWIEERLRGVIRRHYFTTMLEEKVGIVGWEAARLSNWENYALIGCSAKEYKTCHDLPKHARIRDHFSAPLIAAYGLLEAMITEHVEELPDPDKKEVRQIVRDTSYAMATLYDGLKTAQNRGKK